MNLNEAKKYLNDIGYELINEAEDSFYGADYAKEQLTTVIENLTQIMNSIPIFQDNGYTITHVTSNGFFVKKNTNSLAINLISKGRGDSIVTYVDVNMNSYGAVKKLYNPVAADIVACCEKMIDGEN